VTVNRTRLFSSVRPLLLLTSSLFLTLAAGFAVLGAGGTRPSSATPPIGGLRVVDGHIEGVEGRPLQLGGVGRSGTEYQCLTGKSVFAGPTGESSVAALLRWHVEVVRLPLNEDCWLGINRVPQHTSGKQYIDAVTSYVGRLLAHGIAVDLDLHWTAPGTELADRQQMMPDASHAVTLWKSVAGTFGGDPLVVFELYNEPYGVSWSCWLHGCIVPGQDGQPAYQAVGMQNSSIPSGERAPKMSLSSTAWRERATSLAGDRSSPMIRSTP
jgi:hypothetical protein